MNSKPGRTLSIDGLAGRKFVILTVGVILLLTTIVYANSIHNDFTKWDDLSLVVENPAIRSLSIDNLIDIFTPKAGKTYQPVRVLSYAIDYYFWRLNPLGYHLGNTVLHGLSAILLYLLLTSMLNKIRGDKLVTSNRMIALTTALLFTVHPVNVEAVAWIAARKYGLLAFFYFLSFYFFIKTLETEEFNIIYYSFSVVSYTLALLASPFSITLPATLFLYDYCRYSEAKFLGILKQRFFYYLPYVLMSIFYFFILMNALSSSKIIKSHHMNNPFHTLLTMLRALYDYLRNLVFPFWLNNWYFYPPSFSQLNYKIVISLILVVSLAIILFLQVRAGKKLILFCLGWFFITLLPVSNIIPISTKIADRYLYLPAIGLFLCFSLAINTLANKFFSEKLKTMVMFFIIAFLVSSLSYLSVQRNKVWANTITLWTDSLRKAPSNRAVYLNLGEALVQQGKLEEAMAQFREALRLSPNYAEAYNNLGNALVEQGELDEAVAHFAEALRISPDFTEAHNNLAVVLARQGKLQEATKHYSEAVRLNPDSAEAHNNLAVSLVTLGKVQEAVNHYDKAVQLKPYYAEAHNNLGNALAQLGSLEKAIASYEKALEVKPDYAKAHNNLGVALARLGRLDEAIALFEMTLQLQPDFAQARINLRIALEEAGKGDGTLESSQSR